MCNRKFLVCWSTVGAILTAVFIVMALSGCLIEGPDDPDEVTSPEPEVLPISVWITGPLVHTDFNGTLDCRYPEGTIVNAFFHDLDTDKPAAVNKNFDCDVPTEDETHWYLHCEFTRGFTLPDDPNGTQFWLYTENRDTILEKSSMTGVYLNTFYFLDENIEGCSNFFEIEEYHFNYPE